MQQIIVPTPTPPPIGDCPEGTKHNWSHIGETVKPTGNMALFRCTKCFETVETSFT